jgi:hypothetical protein
VKKAMFYDHLFSSENLFLVWVIAMGNPLIMRREHVDVLWRCTQCHNQKEFEEEWGVEINQDVSDDSIEYLLKQSTHLSCRCCGSRCVEEV